MKPSDFQKTIQCQFECKLKKVVKGIIWNYRKELKRRKNKEISFSELPDITVESLATWDDYETNYTIFNVCGIDIKVLDDELAEALKQLPEKKRNNVLMYYFLEMSDTEIADIMNYIMKVGAKAQGVSVSEFRAMLQDTIDKTMESTDPDVQANFKRYFGNKRPTPEEYIYTITKKTKVKV